MFIIFNKKCKMFVPFLHAPLDKRDHWYDGLFSKKDVRAGQLTRQLRNYQRQSADLYSQSTGTVHIQLTPDPFRYLRPTKKPAFPSRSACDIAMNKFEKILDMSKPPMHSDLYQKYLPDSTALLLNRLTVNANQNSRFLITQIISILGSIPASSQKPEQIRIIVIKNDRENPGLSCWYEPAGKDTVTRQPTKCKLVALVPARSLWEDPANVLLGIIFECYNALNGNFFQATTQNATSCKITSVEQGAWKCVIELDTYIRSSRMYAKILEAGGYISPQEFRHLISMDVRLGGQGEWINPSYRPSGKTREKFSMTSHNPGLTKTSDTSFYTYVGFGASSDLGLNPKQLMKQLYKYYSLFVNTARYVNMKDYKAWFTRVTGQDWSHWNKVKENHKLLELLNCIFQNSLSPTGDKSLADSFKWWGLPMKVYDEYIKKCSITAQTELASIASRYNLRVPDDLFWNRFDYNFLDEKDIDASLLSCRLAQTAMARHISDFRKGKMKSGFRPKPRVPRPESELERVLRQRRDRNN